MKALQKLLRLEKGEHLFYKTFYIYCRKFMRHNLLTPQSMSSFRSYTFCPTGLVLLEISVELCLLYLVKFSCIMLDGLDVIRSMSFQSLIQLKNKTESQEATVH